MPSEIKTPNIGLNQWSGNEYVKRQDFVNDNTIIDKILANTAKFEKASGTGTAITLNGIVLEDGASKTFIVSTNNNGSATTINGKKLYKSGTTTAPNLVVGKAVTVWYSQSNDCFYSDTYAAESHAHAVSDITNFPTSLPANGGNADTVGGKTATSFVEKVVVLPNNTDLNTITDSGFYRLSGSTINGPTTSDYSQLLVIHGGMDTIAQMIFRYNSSTLVIRSGNPTNVGGSGIWQPWKEVAVNGTNPTFTAIELSNSIPYIDFHFNNSANDYTSRIIEMLQGVLVLQSSPSDAYTTQIRNTQVSYVDLVAGSSSLAKGVFYAVIE